MSNLKNLFPIAILNSIFDIHHSLFLANLCRFAQDFSVKILNYCPPFTETRRARGAALVIPALFQTGAVFFVLCSAFLFFSSPARAGFLDINEVKEAKLGKEAADAIIREYGIAGDDSDLKRVVAVGRNIIRVCDRSDIEYHFYVLDTDIINAFAIPGGYVFVTRGIMDFVDDDDELASVIGHEVTHVAKKHSVVLYKKSIRDTVVNLLVMVLTRDPNAVMASQMVEQSRTEVFGRAAEVEADRVGLEYMNKAGYDPDGFMRFIMKMQKYETHSPDLLYDYYDFHPPMETRIKLVGDNYRRLGLEPPKGLSYEISGRLVAMEECGEGGKCYGGIKGPRGELLRIGDAGEDGTPYLRARKIAAALNGLFDKRMALYELRKTSGPSGTSIMVRNTKVATVLSGDLSANKSDSADGLADVWIENLKRFLWNDFLKEDL
jgi:Zn-dependent protease with chaperone function